MTRTRERRGKRLTRGCSRPSTSPTRPRPSVDLLRARPRHLLRAERVDAPPPRRLEVARRLIGSRPLSGAGSPKGGFARKALLGLPAYPVRLWCRTLGRGGACLISPTGRWIGRSMLAALEGLPSCRFVAAADVIGDAGAAADLWESGRPTFAQRVSRPHSFCRTASGRCRETSTGVRRTSSSREWVDLGTRGSEGHPGGGCPDRSVTPSESAKTDSVTSSRAAPAVVCLDEQGADLLSKVGRSQHPRGDVDAQHHHERWDGTGIRPGSRATRSPWPADSSRSPTCSTRSPTSDPTRTPGRSRPRLRSCSVYQAQLDPTVVHALQADPGSAVYWPSR